MNTLGEGRGATEGQLGATEGPKVEMAAGQAVGWGAFSLTAERVNLYVLYLA